GPNRATKHHRVDVVDICARLKRQKFVARPKGSDIRELPELLADGRPRGQIFDIAAARARGPHDILDQQLAMTILIYPAVDVHVFGIDVDVSDAGVGISSTINPDVVGVLAPADGADRSEGHLSGPIRVEFARL